MKPVKIPSNTELEVVNNLYPVIGTIKDSIIRCYRDERYRDMYNICIDAIHKYESDRYNYGVTAIDEFEIYLIEINSCDNCSNTERREIVIELLESTGQNFSKDDIPELAHCTTVIMDLRVKDDPEYERVYTYYYLDTLPVESDDHIELVWLS